MAAGTLSHDALHPWRVEYEMRKNSQDDDNYMTEEMDMSMDEIVETGGKNKKASSFSTFSNILAQHSSKDSTTEKIFCASRRGCTSQHNSTTCAKGPI